jgi:hypothetical protein
VDFTSLLEEVQKDVSKTDHQRYELFKDQPELATAFYDYFSLSGASFVVADNGSRKFVLLQKEIKEAKQYRGMLHLPMRRLPQESGVGSRHKWKQTEYNKFCDRIFKIQRWHEGLGEYRSQLILKREPEFLSVLSAEIPKVNDWHKCTALELYIGLLSWRWLHWLCWNFGPRKPIEKLPSFPECYIRQSTPAGGDIPQYFTTEHLKWFGDPETSEFPEYSIAELDQEERWDNLNREVFKRWRSYRITLDGNRPSTQSFEDECVALRNIFQSLQPSADVRGSPDDDRFFGSPESIAAAIHDECKKLPGKTLSNVLGSLHELTKAPLPSYFYFCMIDGRPKEHLIVPVFRSHSFPLVYYIRGEPGHPRQHTAVAIALAALDFTPNDKMQEDRQLFQFQHMLKACANRFIDSIFLRSLRPEKEHGTERRRIVFVSSKDFLPGLFILGGTERNITIFSQQCRSLALVRGLHEMKILELNGEHPIGVLGGGFAGSTATAALLKMGHKVRLYEERSDILTTQEPATHRFIHPYIANWPAAGSDIVDAGLPVLSWQACNANELTVRLRKEFKDIQNETDGRLDFARSNIVKEVTLRDGMIEVRSAQGEPVKHKLVISALGFGQEQHLGLDSACSYWQPDRLEQAPPDLPVLVVGSGDGGLIDLARARLRIGTDTKFDHRRIIELVTKDDELCKLGEIFRDEDNEAQAHILLHGETDLLGRYDRRFDSLDGTLQERAKQFILNLGQQPLDVFYNFRRSFQLGKTILINRLLAFLILKYRLATPIRGEIVRPEVKADERGRLIKLVKFEGAEEVQTFGEICLRVGLRGEYLDTIFSAQKLPGRTDPGYHRQYDRRVNSLKAVISQIDVGTNFDYINTQWYLDEFRRVRSRRA